MIDDNTFLMVIDSTPLVSIDLIIENTQGNYLLGKRVNRPAQGFWFVPGGRIKKNETLADAIQRISMAELGQNITLSDAQLLGAYDHIYDDNFSEVEGINTHYVVLGYKIILKENLTLELDDQHSEVKWCSVKELLSDENVHQNTKLYFADDLTDRIKK